MPSKDSKGSKAGKDPSEVTIQQCGDAIKGTAVVNEVTGRPLKRGEALLMVWTYAMKGEAEREEIFKTGCATNLVSLIEKGDVEERLGAVGAISVLAQSDKHCTEVVTNKVILQAVSILVGEHARGKLPAAQLLSLLAQRPEYANKVAEMALLPLAQTLMESCPGWAQALKLQHCCATTLKALIENVQGENTEVKQARRMALIETGIVPWMVQLIGSCPGLPRPASYPAAPPSSGKAGGGGGGGGKGSKGGDKGGAARYPQGRRQAIATSAAACLRFLALCPSFVEQLMGSGSIQEFIDVLLTSSDVQSAAYISGILWEICSDGVVARAVIRCGAVPVLLHVIATNLAGAGAKKKAAPKGGAKAAPPAPPPAKKSGGADLPSPPINFSELAVCNAAGALHHLTFIDEAKVEVGRRGGVPILVACLKCGGAQIYENATGALWNVGLDVNNVAALKAATAAPGFLAAPVPAGWQLDGTVTGDLDPVDQDSEEQALMMMMGSSRAPADVEREGEGARGAATAFLMLQV